MMNPHDVQRVYERQLVELAREQGLGREVAAERRRKGATAARLRLQALTAPAPAVPIPGSPWRGWLAARLIAVALRLAPDLGAAVPSPGSW